MSAQIDDTLAVWTMPEVTAIGRLPMRASFTPYPDAPSARVAEGGGSPWIRSLNGAWRFLLVESPDATPEGWQLGLEPDDGWRDIEVPGCWTRQGTRDHPHYANIEMPWPLEPPETPDYNPTGLYRTSFTVPRTWRRRQIVLSLGGAESVAIVWCNGFVEDVQLPAEWHDLARVGVRFVVEEKLGRLEWYGLGPDETYPDRLSAALPGIWRSSVAGQYHPYVVPQEHGAHQLTRWFTLLDRRGRGLRVTFDRPQSFSARLHHDADLAVARTLAEVAPSGGVEVHVDRAVRGLGTGACGPDTLPRYQVAGGRHRWTWTLSSA